MFFYGYDPTYIILLPAILLTIFAQSKIKSTYAKYSNVRSLRGLTGYDAAYRILMANGLNNVQIEHVNGNLTDHYDPRSNVLRLSNDVYYGTSVASIGVAAHEVGHAIQHAEGYTPIKIRSVLVPVANFGSRFSWILLLLGIFLGRGILVNLGIYLFCAIVLFQIVTLPVEFNASNRAIRQLSECNIMYEEERSSVKSVLTAAGLTYVAATLTAVLQLVRLLAISSRYRDRR